MNKPVIGIIGGSGKMGQWFANFFAHQGLSVLVSGRKTKLTAKELTRKSDIILLAVPIAEIAATIAAIAPYARKAQLICDVASLKVLALDAMEDLPSATLGMHPLFGPSVGSAAGSQIVFCRQKDNAYVPFLKKLFEDEGLAVLEMSGDEHDYQMAYIQALTHSMNLLFGKIVLDRKNELGSKLYTPIFSLQSLVAGRVLQQDIDMVAQLQIFNPYFQPLLRELIAHAEKLLAAIEKQDEELYKNMFAQEHEDIRNFAYFSTFQTNKILQMVSEIPSAIPQKIVAGGIPKSGTVAFLGPQGTYSHLAATEVFPKPSYKKIPLETLFDLFEHVLNGMANFAVVPAENSTEGTVRETLDYLVDFQVAVVGSFELPIHHQLLSNEKKLADIAVIVSHPQALAQCKNWINRNVPKAKRVSASSSTLTLGNPQKGYGYIASSLAAKNYHMGILAKNIEDNPKNTTRFYIIAKNPMAIKGISNNKTLLFLSVYNRVGILRDILTVFANHNINLAKLESRPSKEKIWDYHFFVEIEQTAKDPNFKKALKELGPYCPIIRILGHT